MRRTKNNTDSDAVDAFCGTQVQALTVTSIFRLCSASDLGGRSIDECAAPNIRTGLGGTPIIRRQTWSWHDAACTEVDSAVSMYLHTNTALPITPGGLAKWRIGSAISKTIAYGQAHGGTVASTPTDISLSRLLCDVYLDVEDALCIYALIHSCPLGNIAINEF